MPQGTCTKDSLGCIAVACGLALQFLLTKKDGLQVHSLLQTCLTRTLTAQFRLSASGLNAAIIARRRSLWLPQCNNGLCTTAHSKEHQERVGASRATRNQPDIVCDQVLHPRQVAEQSIQFARGLPSSFRGRVLSSRPQRESSR